MKKGERMTRVEWDANCIVKPQQFSERRGFRVITPDGISVPSLADRAEDAPTDTDIQFDYHESTGWKKFRPRQQ